MTRALLLTALLAAPALAQTTGDPALAPTADRFRTDLRTITNVVATAALVYDRTGAYPDTPYALLGSRAADQTGLRRTPISFLSLDRSGDQVVVELVPLPSDPYVRTDDVMRITVSRGADGLFTGDYEIRRRQAPADGADPLPYDRTGRYLVTRGFGTACVDLGTVQDRLAAGTYAPEPGTLGTRELTVEVRPVGEAEPVLYRAQ